ncbi:MAG: DUF5709 domain-containing protein [Nocardioidaceae bacterium]|nr:DUF5709 domain-containing protein [Nocardioidaceae bacterium]MCL2613006.1 DUF5709 domain-containing protein [Nocardioidaceae bacterium]
MTSNDNESYGDYSVDDEDQLEPGDTLDDPDVEDELDRGYSPPERYSAGQRWGNTAWEAEHSEPLDRRLAEEDPDPDPYAGDGEPDEAEAAGEHEVGRLRAGRLVDPDEGLGEDTEKDLVGDDVGIDGAAASAEEAAVHVIDDDTD